VRAELERILASEVFSRSDRLSAFLRFIVERTLDGHGDTLKEQVIASELYGKGADFNTAADPIVRVDARRLRDRLREYYAAAPRGPLTIAVPKGSYTPVFTAAGDGTARPAPLPLGAPRIAVAVVVLVVAATAWIVYQRWTRAASDPPARLLTVTSHLGGEEDPALSPEGTFVAYSWHEGPVAPGDLWVKAVDGDAMLRLTNTPDVSEKWAQWSPEGQFIAYTALVQGRPPSVFKISRLGGSPTLIAERAAHAVWTPDGKSIVMVRVADTGLSLVEHVLETGAQRTLVPTPAGFQDTHLRISPDGRALAFMRADSGRSAIFVIPMAGGDARQLGDWSNGPIGGLSWTPDGREMIFARPELSGRRFVRVPASGARPAVYVPGVPPGAVGPSTSLVRGQRGFRLAFTAGQSDLALRLVDLQAPREGVTFTAVTPFCDATRFDAPGRFSPDGTIVAFTSDRLGNQQVWIAGRDGSSPRSLTNLPDAVVNVGGWSPDGRWIAFDAAIGGKTAIYRVSLEGVLQQLTDDAATNSDPDWSRDGAWIYYASTASGRSEIWKRPAGGGKAVQLTSEGGFEPRTAPDGRSVYFVDRARPSALMRAALKRVSTEGGPSSAVYDGIYPGAWDVTDGGIVFVTQRAREGARSQDRELLAVLDAATGGVTTLGELPFRVSPYGVRRFLIASRDGRWAIASYIDRWERDVMVLENVR
jgi:Tol biopolymer transport system component